MHINAGVLKRIIKESKRMQNTENKGNEEEFSRFIFEEIFRHELGYERSDWARCGKQEVVVDGRLKIKITLDEADERSVANQLFWDYKDGRARENLLEWGIVISFWGIWLFNNQIYNQGREEFQAKKTVLEIVYGKNLDQGYFDFFSYDNILGNAPNTCYFKDIAEYRNRYYGGSEKSWPAYSSSLKRFFRYFSQYTGYFKNAANSVYDKVKITDFYFYIKKETKLEKENTLKNVFFYLKDFMGCMSAKGNFDISTKDMLEGFSGYLKKDEKLNVINPVKIKQAVQYLNHGKNKERDVAMFLMELSFGLERRKLRLLKWHENIECDDKGNIGSVLNIEGKNRSMPDELVEALNRLKALKIEGQYVFYRTKENGKEPMREDMINAVFSKLVNINLEDDYYKSLTPANIRSSLVRYLLEKGEPLDKIIYFMDIEIWNLGNYISLKDINGIFEKRIAEKKETGEHLMNSFFKDLLA